jgi:hypothetical protein
MPVCAAAVGTAIGLHGPAQGSKSMSGLSKNEIPDYYEVKRAIEILALDRRDWAKREPEWDNFRSYLEIISKRLDAVETHLEHGAASGRAFVRAQERPTIGAETLQSILEPIHSLTARLDRIEQQLAQGEKTRGKVGGG